MAVGGGGFDGRNGVSVEPGEATAASVAFLMPYGELALRPIAMAVLDGIDLLFLDRDEADALATRAHHRLRRRDRRGAEAASRWGGGRSPPKG